MESGQHSYMAEATAMLRAMHQVVDDEPKVLDDPLAVRILGDRARRNLDASLERFQTPWLIKARTFAIMRSRFMEDHLAAAIKNGVSQYLILGAGLDTSAYRTAALRSDVQVFEVDHPDTQAWKLNRLSEARIEVPGNVTFVAVDFETQKLDQELCGRGFETGRTTFVSWLGVTYYLERGSVMETLRFISGLGSGTCLVFDFALEPAAVDEVERAAISKVSNVVASNNEPWLTHFLPGVLHEELEKLGFKDVLHLGRDDATRRYLKDRSDGLQLSDTLHVIFARV